MDEDGEIGTVEKPRTAARRRQVLEAATICFRRFGFHSASMARIAEQAGMSVGHIYRYFPGKETIIAAIVRDQVDQALDRFPANEDATADVPRILLDNALHAVHEAYDLDRAALMLEIRAEAARNTAVAAIVREADAEIATRVRRFIVSGLPSGDVSRDLDRRVEMLSLIIYGVTVRAVSQVDGTQSIVDELVEFMVRAIFTPSPCFVGDPGPHGAKIWKG